MSKEGKHHYIPVFYLKQWAGADGRICEFSKPYDRVKPRRVHPDGTAYVHGLNTIQGLPPDEAQYLETYFFKIADGAACRALRILLGGKSWQFTADERSGWSRFIVSLAARNPESLAKHMAAGQAIYQEALPRLQADYKARKLPTDPPTYEEYAARRSPNPGGRAGAILLQTVIDSPMIGNWINQMRWMVLHDARPPFLLLTSDRPIVMTNGIVHPNSQIILPISPRHVFVATNNVKMENFIRDVMHRRQLIQQINERVTRQSRKFVYGYDDAQLAFLSKRLGMKYTADPLENISLDVPRR
jgi:hypothetical protein